jgi:two-component system OmpR family sensor kinase
VTPGGRTRAPIALQLMALLVVSLIAAQLMTFAAVVLMPPPARAVYRMEDVAQALKGGSLHPRYGRELTREVQKEAPTEPPEIRPARDPNEPRRRPPAEWSRRELALMVGVREGDVRLIQQSPFPGMILRGPFGVRVPMRFERGFMLHQDGKPDSPGGQNGPGDRLDGPGFGDGAPSRGFSDMAGGPPQGEMGAGPGPGGRPRGDVTYVAGGPRGFRTGGPPLFGEFTAALRQADGAWLVVRPKPESFPNDWQRRLLLWLGSCILLTAPLGYMFARRITAPLGRFARAAETLGRDPSGPLMALSGPAEIGMAARAFNDMQARLKRYIDDRTAMVGAISHDLRTPLARIRFKLEAAPEGVKSAVLADVEQMEQMIASVLAFIRDASAGRSRERLDLLSLVECVVDDAAQTGQDVTLDEDSAPVTVEADALGLQRLLGNLVDNAVKYGHRARIRVSEVEGEALVEIADDGPGLSSVDLERVFQPFYRAEAARTLDGGGVGLGLAVARSIARAHGGDVILASGLTGLVARVRLPRSACEPQGRRAGARAVPDAA